ncbi:hypothetical protein INT47_011184 [Mucor saturninus]|uniref:Galactose oxidase n=1 Tax=Mucor saturninus TaxID=64648 RepID=A0A8H7VA94_9FUNG|nr:hypothetical protein INT47_011184 [Mucor saturninus]
MNVLDLTTLNEKTPEELSSKWANIDANTKSQNIESRVNPQSTQLPDGKTLLIVGGGIGGVSQTISFNGETMSWDFYQNYKDPSTGNRNISSAASVYIPEYGFVLYGGIEDVDSGGNNFTYPGVNTTSYTNDGDRYIGYPDLEILDINNTENPWRPHISENNKTNIFPNNQAAIFDSKNNIIFFFGGSHYNPTTGRQVPFLFDKVMTFNLNTKSWGEQALKGQGPSPRYAHSATVVGPKQRHVLIYGGKNGSADRPVSDYCYTLDLDTYQWTQQIIPAPNGIILARSMHSAVTITDSMLFIVFGRTADLELAITLLILNVTNPSSITLFDKFIDPATIVPTNTTSDSFNATSSKGLTSGAIIGIAVGVSVAGIIGIALILFYAIKKRKNNKTEKEESLMEVDWEEVENEYPDAPADYPETHFKHSSQTPDDMSGNQNTMSETQTTQAPNSFSPTVTKNPDAQSVQVPDSSSPTLAKKTAP